MIGVGWRSRGRGTVSGSACVGRFGVGSGIVGVVFVHWGVLCGLGSVWRCCWWVEIFAILVPIDTAILRVGLPVL